MLAGTALLRLLQLASPSLPIGAYSYSQGLEGAIDLGLVHDAASARDWIGGQLLDVVAHFDAPLQWRLLQAFDQRDGTAARGWSERWLASRDTFELRAETVQMGYSLRQLLVALQGDEPHGVGLLELLDEASLSLPAAYACAAAALGVPAPAALLGAVFSWTENQVLVCVKTVPLGQVAGQKMLLALSPLVEIAVRSAQELPDAALSNWAPGLSLLSMRHEVQYSRLYRS
ncbi:MAG: urease accessory protein UreF [Massilia sp.]|nr:urease accessory protein UreF [Massilia sp.]MDB5792798.1 urease accessory protein UreF [Massilia sp.]